MTSDEILMAILSKPNGSTETSVGFITDLHEYSKTSVKIIKSIDNPRKSIRALMLKEQIETLLQEYDRLKRQPPKTKRK